MLSSLSLEKTVLGGKQFLKRDYSEAIIKDVFGFQDFYQH